MPAALRLKLTADASCEARRGEAALRARKSFLVLFFKKEHASLPSC
jgi:hypothetical protein